MSIPEIPEIGEALKKSSTHSFALPNISRTRTKMPQYKTSRISNHKSVFLDKVKDLTQDVKYEQMEVSNITQQQKKLKYLLREFNQETYHILGRYIDKPIDEYKKPRSTSIAVVSEVRDKQIINCQEVMDICKKQLALLEKRSENLKFVTLFDFQTKIYETKDKIQETRAVNKQFIKSNTLRGLGLKKDDQKIYNEVSDLEQQRYILEVKKSRLVSDTQYVNDEGKSLEQKSNEADKKITQITEEYNQIIAEQQKKSSQNQIKFRLSSKKKVLDRNKKQKQANSLSYVVRANRLQGQYLKMLKDLEQLKKNLNKIQNDTKQTEIKVESTKRQVLINEHKLSLMKKGIPNDKNMDQIIQEAKQKQGCNTN